MTKVPAMGGSELKNNAALEQMYSNSLGWLVWFSLFSWSMRTVRGGS